MALLVAGEVRAMLVKHNFNEYQVFDTLPDARTGAAAETGGPDPGGTMDEDSNTMVLEMTTGPTSSSGGTSSGEGVSRVLNNVAESIPGVATPASTSVPSTAAPTPRITVRMHGGTPIVEGAEDEDGEGEDDRVEEQDPRLAYIAYKRRMSRMGGAGGSRRPSIRSPMDSIAATREYVAGNELAAAIAAFAMTSTAASREGSRVGSRQGSISLGNSNAYVNQAFSGSNADVRRTVLAAMASSGSGMATPNGRFNDSRRSSSNSTVHPPTSVSSSRFNVAEAVASAAEATNRADQLLAAAATGVGPVTSRFNKRRPSAIFLAPTTYRDRSYSVF